MIDLSSINKIYIIHGYTDLRLDIFFLLLDKI